MDEEIAKPLKNKIDEAIITLLELAYNGLDLRKHKYSGYPTCDLIACFFGTEETLENRFFDIFNKVETIPKEYKDNWDLFQDKKLKSRIDQMLEDASNLEEGVKSNFDTFSEQGVISNVGLASVLLLIYGFKGGEKSWIEENKDKLVKSTNILLTNRIAGGGWPYLYSSRERERYTHTLSTWLSMLALNYVPKEIGNAIKADWEKEVEIIKSEVKEWLINNIYKDNDYCSWSFRPGETYDYNPVATAQAILALYYTGVTGKEDHNIKGAIEYIKNNEDNMANAGSNYKVEELMPPVEYISHNYYAGVQHCLHALLRFGITFKDETIQNLLDRTLEIIPKLDKGMARDLSNCYAILQPLLLSSPSIRPIVLLNSSALISKFESFVSEAKSIVIIGEIDGIYGGLIPQKDEVHVKSLCREEQHNELVERFEKYGWDCNWIDKSWGLDSINYIIVDGKKALFSSNPFKRLDQQYTHYNYLDSGEVSDLINQLEEITGIDISRRGDEDIIDQIYGLDGVKNYPEQWDKYMRPGLEKMSSEQQEGILQYFKYNPEYTESSTATLGFDGGDNIETELAGYGIISRVFTNGELKGLIKNEIKDKNLVLDESSAYMLLKSTNGEENIKDLLSSLTGDLCVLSNVYSSLESLKLPNSDKGRLRRIEDRTMDIEIESGDYHLTENEKITIAYTEERKNSKYGMVTNKWEVAKECIGRGINVYSIVKFLDKDEETYKMFRIPIDLLKEA